MAIQFGWDGTPLPLALLDAVASDLKTRGTFPGTPLFHFTIHAVIIRYFLGDDWFRDHLLPNSQPKSFLRPKFSSAQADPYYSARILELAEMLLNLQFVAGFRRCLEHLAPKQMQSGLAELQIGQVLRSRGVPFRYVEEDDQTTVDVVFQMPNGVEAFGEIKCKEEDTPYSDATLAHALRKARQQIGEGNAGVVFVKVPSAWVEISQGHATERANIRLPDAIRAAADDAMRSSSRIKKVIFHVVHYAYDPAWGIGATHATMEMTNPRNCEPWVDDLLGPYAPDLWVRLPDLSKRWE